jgi:hypothetical protein
MKTIWRGRVRGEFHGSLIHRVYVLSDGSWWRQEDSTSEIVRRRTDPKAKLLAGDDGRIFLDVECAALSVWVVPVGEGLRLFPEPSVSTNACGT